MHPGVDPPPYDTAKEHPRPLSRHDFKWKKLEIPLAPMVNHKRARGDDGVAV